MLNVLLLCFMIVQPISGILISKHLYIFIQVSGVFAFFKRQLPEYMFLRSPFVFFDYNEPTVFFLLDYLAVMLLFAFAGYLTIQGFSARERSKTENVKQCRI